MFAIFVAFILGAGLNPFALAAGGFRFRFGGFRLALRSCACASCLRMSQLPPASVRHRASLHHPPLRLRPPALQLRLRWSGRRAAFREVAMPRRSRPISLHRQTRTSSAQTKDAENFSLASARIWMHNSARPWLLNLDQRGSRASRRSLPR